MNKVAYTFALLLTLIGFSSFLVSPQNNAIEEPEKINWLTLEEAQKLSEKEPRKIIMDVYTDWCGWCKKMDKTTFSDAEVAKFVNKHFYAVKLKADSNDKLTFKGQEFTNAQFAQALRISGYPTVVFFGENFSKFQPVSGYRQAGEFKEILEVFLNADDSEEAGK